MKFCVDCCAPSLPGLDSKNPPEIPRCGLCYKTHCFQKLFGEISAGMGVHLREEVFFVGTLHVLVAPNSKRFRVNKKSTFCVVWTWNRSLEHQDFQKMIDVLRAGFLPKR